MKERDKTFRMKLSTWRELRAYFPAKRKESVAEYMERFVEFVIVQSQFGFTEAEGGNGK